MKYIIKELSILTGIKGSTIRKWQERYNLLYPELAQNGYWYYSNEDYLILVAVSKLLAEGKRISKIAAMGKENLLAIHAVGRFSPEEMNCIQGISNNNFRIIKEFLDNKYKNVNLKTFIEQEVVKILVLVGNAWESGLLSVSEEHSFSRWMYGYLMEKTLSLQTGKEPVYLVASFPGDVHELGALLHYILLLNDNIGARFVGILPLKYIISELKKGNYHTVGFSLTLPQKMASINKVKKKILENTQITNVLFGGRGYEISKRGGIV